MKPTVEQGYALSMVATMAVRIIEETRPCTLEWVPKDGEFKHYESCAACFGWWVFNELSGAFLVHAAGEDPSRYCEAARKMTGHVLSRLVIPPDDPQAEGSS